MLTKFKKIGIRRQSREIALQILYQIEFLQIDFKDAISLFWKNFKKSKICQSFSSNLIEGTIKNIKDIDNLIATSSEKWQLKRMSIVDKNILRLAIYELLYCHDIPPKVTLNEAIDLGKSFGSEKSGSFINGILQSICINLKKL